MPKPIVRRIIDNIDHGNIGHLIDWDMIVRNGMGFPHLKKVAITKMMPISPYLVDNASGILNRNSFLIKPCTFCPHHIQQNSIKSRVTRDMRRVSPMLGAKTPPLRIIATSLLMLGHPIIFPIEQDKVYPDVQVLAG